MPRRRQPKRNTKVHTVLPTEREFLSWDAVTQAHFINVASVYVLSAKGDELGTFDAERWSDEVYYRLRHEHGSIAGYYCFADSNSGIEAF